MLESCTLFEKEKKVAVLLSSINNRVAEIKMIENVKHRETLGVYPNQGCITQCN